MEYNVIKDRDIIAVTTSRKAAVSEATNAATAGSQVFIETFRASDGQKGYLNPDGYSITGESW